MSRHSIQSQSKRQGKALFVSPSEALTGMGSIDMHSPTSPSAQGNNEPNPEPELVCREKELDPHIEDEIKDGFFELRQKFKGAGEGESSIYVSHVVLHAKHPIFGKVDIDTLKNILSEASIIYLNKDQILYRNGSQDNFVYFILFGKLALVLPQSVTANPNGGLNVEASLDSQSNSVISPSQITLGKVNIGWTVGEEVLFDKNLQVR